MLNTRDTIITVKRRCLYLAAALAIVEEHLQYSFRVEASTICKFIPEVCKAIIAVYKDEALPCPKTEEEGKEVATRFSFRWNYHSCMGAVDGKHIAMKKPPIAGSYYYNDKSFHSIVLMAVADATYKFLYVDVYAEGGASDGGTWSSCSLHDAVEANRAGVPQPEPLPNDEQPVPYHFVGDDAFALRTWMMKPFSHQSQILRERIHIATGCFMPYMSWRMPLEFCVKGSVAS
ncbi:uncharacterized protein [Palaemon carinicauda]|uniref:uncharacterized protein n=1 Tax=Palaemon carinicauda TaxID=392227 RepID=UPI0035B60C13